MGRRPEDEGERPVMSGAARSLRACRSGSLLQSGRETSYRELGEFGWCGCRSQDNGCVSAEGPVSGRRLPFRQAGGTPLGKVGSWVNCHWPHPFALGVPVRSTRPGGCDCTVTSWLEAVDRRSSSRVSFAMASYLMIAMTRVKAYGNHESNFFFWFATGFWLNGVFRVPRMCI